MLNQNGYIVLIDYGVAAKLESDKAEIQNIAGTLEYMCPEMLNYQTYGKSCDWWSTGLILY